MDSSSSKTSSSKKTDGSSPPDGSGWKETKNTPRERELERKRARGEISCAECRRLKLKCNKKVPCASCVRRGCHSICPNGQLATGHGSRFVLANTHKLHGKLHEMSKRIRQLEDSLQIAQASLSPYPHPLLSDDLLAIKSGVDVITNETTQDSGEDFEDPALVEAFETLSVSARGEGRSIGRLASEVLLMSEIVDETVSLPASSSYENVMIPSNLPEEILRAAYKSPFILQNKKTNIEHTLRLIEARFPSFERATALTEAYLQNVSWLARPIEREQITNELLPYVKQRRLSALKNEIRNMKGPEDDLAHRVYTTGLAFALFACGSAADLTQKPDNEEGLTYIFFARTALGLHTVFGHGECLELVQALMLVASYDFFSCWTASLDFQWKVLSYAIVIAIRLGLHRDPEKWNMEPKMVQRRRITFWNICAFDRWKALGSGRPAIFRMQDSDVEFPEEVDFLVTDDGSLCPGFYTWRHQFVRDIIGPISELLCVATPIKYSRIMDFDRKIREFPNPPYISETIHVRSIMYYMYKEIALLFLHKNFFARAMLTDSGNPLRSPFAPSFLAAYALSIKFLRHIRKAFDKSPEILIRQWPIIGHTLSVGVIVGSIASRGSFSPLVTAAYRELKLAISLLERVSFHPVATRGLPALYRLRDRASLAIDKDSKVSPALSIAQVINTGDTTPFNLSSNSNSPQSQPSNGNFTTPDRVNLSPQTSNASLPMAENMFPIASSNGGSPAISGTLPSESNTQMGTMPLDWFIGGTGNPTNMRDTTTAFGINPHDFIFTPNSVSSQIMSDSLQTLYVYGTGGQIKDPNDKSTQRSSPSTTFTTAFPEMSPFTNGGAASQNPLPKLENLPAQASPTSFEQIIRNASLHNTFQQGAPPPPNDSVSYGYQWPFLEGRILSTMGMDDLSFAEDWSFQAMLEDDQSNSGMNLDCY